MNVIMHYSCAKTSRYTSKTWLQNRNLHIYVVSIHVTRERRNGQTANNVFIRYIDTLKGKVKSMRYVSSVRISTLPTDK